MTDAVESDEIVVQNLIEDPAERIQCPELNAEAVVFDARRRTTWGDGCLGDERGSVCRRWPSRVSTG